MPLSTKVSALLDKPFVPYGPTTIALFVLVVVVPLTTFPAVKSAVIFDSTASVQPSPSLSKSNLLGTPSPSVSNSVQFVVVPLKVTDLAFIITSDKTLGLLAASLYEEIATL